MCFKELMVPIRIFEEQFAYSALNIGAIENRAAFPCVKVLRFVVSYIFEKYRKGAEKRK